jgi:predicted CXXCH cytochrome family protein
VKVRIAGALVAASLILAGPSWAQERMAGFLREEYSCVMCHTDMREDFLLGVHADRGIVCADCHDGDPGDFQVQGAHSGDFRGFQEKVEAVDLCLQCHEDLSRMRQFGLDAVTREEFLLSVHGQRLLEQGDTAAPSCSDCHGSHSIFARQDVRSRIHPLRVAETCSSCHDDPGRMSPEHEGPHLDEWLESAHGRALLTRHNTAAATCASCHGSHSALPPGVSEISNVCGQCHTLVRQAYVEGWHSGVATARVGAVGCTACHDNHGTEIPEPEEIPALCAPCHAEGSAPALVGLQLQEELTGSEHAAERAEEAIEELIGAGQPTYDEEARLLTLRTHLHELGVAVHALDTDRVGELARRVGSLATEIGERADIVGEERWERKLLLIPLWLGILAVIALAIRKRRRLATLGAVGEAIEAFFFESMAAEEGHGLPTTPQDLRLAACAILLELAYADARFSPEERGHLDVLVRRQFGLGRAEAERLLRLAEEERVQAVDVSQFTDLVSEHYSHSQKVGLLRAMWGLVMSDGELASREGYLMDRIARLLRLDPEEIEAVMDEWEAAEAER